MDGTKLWMKAIVAVLIVFIMSVSGCVMRTDYRIAQAIKGGSDPVVSRLAFSNGEGRAARLVYLAMLEDK
jgi:hypothetical protein